MNVKELSRARKGKTRLRARSAQDGYAIIPRYLQPEIKYLDSSINTSFDYNGQLVNATAISLGTGTSGRNGQSIHPISLDLDSRVTVAATSPVTIRMFIVRLLLDSAPFTLSDFLTNVGSGLVTQAPYNINTSGQSFEDRRIEVIFDATSTVATNYEPVWQVKKQFNLKGAAHGLVRFDGGTTTPICGAIYFGYVSTLAGPAGLPAASAIVRLHYLDS